jgi:hypothetical protein
MPGILKAVFLFSFVLSGLSLFADDYLISLKGLHIKSSITGYYVDRVINATGESSCIGSVQTGAFNKLEPAFMKPSIEAEIEKCLKTSFPESASLKPLILRINHVNIYEITGSAKEISCVDLSVSFITMDGTGYVEQFLAGDSYERSGLDVTGFHAENIVESFGNCFDDFFKMVQSGHTGFRRISEGELHQNPLGHPEQFAILRQNHIPRGLFKSFYSFRDCQPDTVTQFKVKYHVPRKDTTRVRASLELTDNTMAKKYYGFSDGKDIFIWAGSGYARAKREEHDIRLRVDKDDVSTSSGMYMGAMFGLLGGLIDALASQVPSSAASSPGSCIVDFVYGHLLPADKPGYLKPQSTTILFLSKTSASDKLLSVMHDRDTICTLNPGQYLNLTLSSQFREAQLLLTGQGCTGKEEKITPRLFNTDIYIVKIKRNGEISVSSTYEEVRKTLLYAMTPENTIVMHDLGQKLPVN